MDIKSSNDMMMWTIDARSKQAKGVGPNKLLVKHIT